MNENDLAAMGYMIDPENPSKGIPLPKKPTADMEVPELESLARQEYQRLIVAERQTVASYWRLGEYLRCLQKKVGRGNWQDYVRAELKMNLTRAGRALRLHKNFKRVEDCQNLGLIEALDYTPREPKPTSDASETPSSEEPNSSPSFGVVGGEPDLDSDEDDVPDEEPDEDFGKPPEEAMSPLYELMTVVRGLQTVDAELKDLEIDEATQATLNEQVSFVDELVASIKDRLGGEQ